MQCLFLMLWPNAHMCLHLFPDSAQNSLPWELMWYICQIHIQIQVRFQQFSTILNQHYAQTCLTTTLCLVHTGEELSRERGVGKRNRKRGAELTEEEGIGRKVENRSYVTGIRVILLTPSTQIHLLRWCMKIHLCYKPVGKTTQRKRERERYKGWMEE